MALENLKSCLFVMFVFTLLTSAALIAQPKVTYDGDGDRLGDQLIKYLHSKWISYQYGLPLAYRPFLYSDAFALYDLETPLSEPEKLVSVTDLSMLDHLEDKIYEIRFVTECREEYTSGNPYWIGRPYISIDWDDEGFLNWVRPYLLPRIPVKLRQLPTDKVTVALHVRRPYGVDNYESIYQVFPYKFLPDQFYIDQLRWVYEEMGRRPLYVYIFSNDPKAKRLASTIQMALKNRQITFDFPKILDETKEGILSDFYSMMHFDCIIRPDSHLSFVASKLGYQSLIISPEHVSLTHKGNIVDRVKIERR